jgi:hypothetical protein
VPEGGADFPVVLLGTGILAAGAPVEDASMVVSPEAGAIRTAWSRLSACLVGRSERQEGVDELRAQKQKPHHRKMVGLCGVTSLTMTYFHTGCSTIIGAKSFHGPVRDGKGWYQLAIVIRHNL